MLKRARVAAARRAFVNRGDCAMETVDVKLAPLIGDRPLLSHATMALRCFGFIAMRIVIDTLLELE